MFGRGLAGGAVTAAPEARYHRLQADCRTRVVTAESTWQFRTGHKVPGEVKAAGLQQSKLVCALDRCTPVRHAELAVHRALVGLHRVERDKQSLTDLASRQPGGEQAKDFELLGR